MEYIEMVNFLNEVGKTKEDMDMMWNYCCDHGHGLICQLDKCGKSWSDMNTHALKTLEREYNKLKGESGEG